MTNSYTGINTSEQSTTPDFFYSLDRPLHSLPDRSQVSAVNLYRFPELVSRLGGNYREILERHSINPEILTIDKPVIDCQPFVDMLEYCSSRLNDPLFGLHLASIQDAEIYGCVSVLSKSAPTVHQGLVDLIEFLPVVHSPESVLELVEGVSTSELRWTEHSDFGLNDQADGQGLLLNLNLLRSLAGKDFVPDYVNVSVSSYQKAGNDIEKAIACPVRASRERSCIAFPTALLYQPSINTNNPLYHLLKGYLERLKHCKKPGLLNKVNEFISAGLLCNEVTIDACANQLGLSPRILQMRLKSMNVTYSDLLARHRLQRAKSKLRHSDLSIAEIADLLGYAERTSFGRAFKQWTGLTPQQFRKQH